MQQPLSNSHSWTLKGGAVFLSALQVFASCSMVAYAQNNTADTQTRTPIKHVIVIIGENRSFDHVFATYKPQAARQSTTCCRRELSTPMELRDRICPSHPVFRRRYW